MNLELNLVKIENIYSQASKIIARRRVLVGNDTEAMSQIISFITDNIDIFNSILTDKSLVAKLENLQSLSIDEFQCLRYILAENGVDILIWAIADVETNEDGVPTGQMEYNLVDRTNYSSNFIPFCTKLNVMQNDFKVSDVYKKIVNLYGLFNSTLFEDRPNPILNDITVMEQQESVLGTAPVAVTTHVNSILEFVGKITYVIMN